LVIDNYDSFTFNLVQLLGKYKNELLVLKNDENITAIRNFQPEKILISPGPGRPENSGLTLAAIEELKFSSDTWCLSLVCRRSVIYSAENQR
jgi:anthranilate/para-aminobenzoate synthase component II